MKNLIQQLYQKHPNGVISTNMVVSGEILIVQADISEDNRQLASASRAYMLSAEQKAVDSIETVCDALMFMGISTSGPVPQGTDSVETPCASQGSPQAPLEPAEESGNTAGNQKPSEELQEAPEGHPPDAELDNAKKVLLEFLPGSSAPITVRSYIGKTLGEIANSNPAFLKYLTCPAGRTFVPDNVAAAAKAIMKSISG